MSCTPLVSSTVIAWSCFSHSSIPLRNTFFWCYPILSFQSDMESILVSSSLSTACTHAHMYTCTHARMHTCTHAHARMHTHTCMHTHAHTRTHTHTRTHAHTHTHSQLLQRAVEEYRLQLVGLEKFAHQYNLLNP